MSQIDPRSYTYLNGKRVSFIPFSRKQPNFAIIRGLAGSGKSTFASTLNLPVIDIDELTLSFYEEFKDTVNKRGHAYAAAVEYALEEVESFLRAGHSCALVGILHQHDAIAPFLKIARAYRIRNIHTFTCVGEFETSMTHLSDYHRANMARRFEA